MARSPFLRPMALARESAGVTTVEFAMIAPVLVLTLLGLFDMGYNMYAQTLLQGALQQAARNSTIEGASSQTGAIDASVQTAVGRAIGGATFSFARKSYTTFSQVGQPEDWTDTDGNGTCNGGEPYEDANGNGTWDRDRGVSGLGGARDAVLYTATVTYPRAFPLARLARLPNTVTLSASTVLRNQPYAQSQAATVVVRNCS